MGTDKKIIIISAINLTSGGSFSILKDCLDYLSKFLVCEYKIIALVNDIRQLDCPSIKLYGFPLSKKSWIFRIFYEYLYFRKISNKFKPYLWLSLHDISPNVNAKIRAVYCHNPAPFYKISLPEIYYEPVFFLFNLFYKWIYKININKNNYIIVQQQWLRNKFSNLFNIDKSKIIVSFPDINIRPPRNKIGNKLKNTNKEYIFFYPSFPRVFKNFELICEAVYILNKANNNQFKIFFTIDGTENKYSKYIYNKYSNIRNIHFVGIMNREKVFDYYSISDCLLFPSKLETWGLPITEMKIFKKPILAADLEYAHETVGEYDRVYFFNPYSVHDLAKKMDSVMKKHNCIPHIKQEVDKPFAENWSKLFKFILETDNVD